MKLVEDDRDTNCNNGTDISNSLEKKMTSLDSTKVSTNDDNIMLDDSRSNGESITDSGDLLIEDTNVLRNGTEDSFSQNGSKADDTRSWSSNSSNFPPPDIEEDLSDEMTLRLSDCEEDPEPTIPRSVPTSNEKDDIPFSTFTSSPLLTDNPCTISNPFNELLEEDKDLPLSPTQTEENIDKETITKFVEEDTQKANDDAADNNTQIEENKEKDSTESDIESLINDIVPEKEVLDSSTDNMTVTELSDQIEEILKKSPNEESDEEATKTAASVRTTTTSQKSNEEKVDATVETVTDKDSDKTCDDCIIQSDVAQVTTCESNSDTTELIKDVESNLMDAASDNITEDDATSGIGETETKSNVEDSSVNITDAPKTQDTIIENGAIANKSLEIIDDNLKVDQNNSEITEIIDSAETSFEENKDDVILTVDSNSEVVNIEENDVEMEVDTDKAANLEESNSVELMDTKSTADIQNSSEQVQEINTNTESKQLAEPINSSVPTNTDSEQLKQAEPTNTSVPINTDSEQLGQDEPMEICSDNSKLEEAETISDSVNEEETTTKRKSCDLLEVGNKLENNLDINVNSDSKDDIKIELETELEESDDNKTLKDNMDEGTKSLKRPLNSDSEELDAKKPKINGIIATEKKQKDYVPATLFREFMSKKEINTLTRAELEEFCLQKMCESINHSSKIGELNRLLRQHEQGIESFRTKYNGLKKQLGDMTIVQNKIMQELRALKANKDDSANCIIPVKITRSVGLQVALPIVRNIRSTPASPEQLQPAAPVQKRNLQRISFPNKLPSAQTPGKCSITPAKPASATIPKPSNGVAISNRNIKTLLPRTFNASEINKDQTSTNSLLSNYLSNPTTTKTNPTTTVRKTIPTTATTTTTTTANANKVIDLTDEDDVAKTSTIISPPPSNIRIVAPHQINNANTNLVNSQMQRVTYLVSPGPGQQGQVLLATTTAPTRPGGPRPTIMLKPVQGGSVTPGQRVNIVRPNVPGSTVAVMPATSSPTIRPGQQIRFQTSGATTVTAARTQMAPTRTITVARHPAPLPASPAVQASPPNWKALPPRPSLKISRVGDGIVLSWKMINKDMSLYEEIASYQLYAYQETNAAPSTDMWRKVGDVKALALPMACTLTQFTDGNKYHFAVRAVDVKSRVGPFSPPEQIALP